MVTNKWEQFKFACLSFLNRLTINDLRPYARYLGIEQPTTKNKAPLIEEIIKILTGEQKGVTQSTRGAPVRNSDVKPEILSTIEFLYKEYAPKINLDALRPQTVLELRAKDEPTTSNKEQRIGFDAVYRGQLQTFDGVSVLVPLSCKEPTEKIIIPVAFIQKHHLKEGDVISCFAQKSNTSFIATEILTINEQEATEKVRPNFEDKDVAYPTEKINFYRESKDTPNVTQKYLHWLFPLKRGQRGCILSTSKMDASKLLQQMIKYTTDILQNLEVFALVTGQSPELRSTFKSLVKEDNLIATTYDDDYERQVQYAEFILRRAKRYAENGRDVILFVDSFDSLATAYNSTDLSIGGKVIVSGLESKTLHYIKKYLGTARAFQGGGSLTIVGTLNVHDNNAVNEAIVTELCNVSNWEIHLDEITFADTKLSVIDVEKSKMQSIISDSTSQSIDFIVNHYLKTHSQKQLYDCIDKSESIIEFKEKIGFCSKNSKTI